MSQCFEWGDYDKQERLEPIWMSSDKLWGTSWTGCDQNNAVLTLLSDRWSGDRLVWFGCEGLNVYKADTPFKRQLLSDSFYDDFLDYRDVAGIFPDARGKVGYDWGHAEGELGDVPYEGPFDTPIRWLRYVVNLDKRQFIDRERTAVQQVAYGEVWRDDLFPFLSVPWDWEPSEGEMGMWFGDRLTATNELPAEDFEDLTYLKSGWSVRTDLTNEEILAYVNHKAPNDALGASAEYRKTVWHGYEKTAWHRYANERLRELIGTDTAGHVVR